MTSALVVETPVNVISNSPSQNYTHPIDHNLPTYEILACVYNNNNSFVQRGFGCGMKPNLSIRFFEEGAGGGGGSENGEAGGRGEHLKYGRFAWSEILKRTLLKPYQNLALCAEKL